MKSILFFVGLIFVLSGLIAGGALVSDGASVMILYVIIIAVIGLILIGFSGIIDRLDKIIKLLEK